MRNAKGSDMNSASADSAFWPQLARVLGVCRLVLCSGDGHFVPAMCSRGIGTR